MWLAKNMKRQTPTADARSGNFHHCERPDGRCDPRRSTAAANLRPRRVCMAAESGASVLVIKGGPGGEEQCVCGGKQAAAPKGMLPGEIYLYSSGSSVYLRKNGAIELSGRVSIKGTLVVNGQPYKPCSCGEGGLL